MNVAQQTIILSGQLDANKITQMRADFDFYSQSELPIILDLSGVYFMDSSGIGAIVFLYKRLLSKGLSLVVSGLNGQPAELFKMLHLDQTIDCFSDTDTKQGMSGRMSMAS